MPAAARCDFLEGSAPRECRVFRLSKGMNAGVLLTFPGQREWARQAYEPLAVGAGFRVPATAPAGVRESPAARDGGKLESGGAARAASARAHRALIGRAFSRLRLRAR